MKKATVISVLITMLVVSFNPIAQAGDGIEGIKIPFFGGIALFPGGQTAIIQFPAELPSGARAMVKDIIITNGNPEPVGDTDISYINIIANTASYQYTLWSTIRTMGNERTEINFTTGIPTQAGTINIGVANLSMSSAGITAVQISGYFYLPLGIE